MTRLSSRPFYVMGGLIAAFLLTTGLAGVVDNGIYRPFLSEQVVVFQFFQDLVSLCFAPLLVLMMILARHGSRRAFVIWLGILVYVAYYYSFYAFDYVLTVYYPLYLALVGLSMYSLIGMLASVDMVAFQVHLAAKMPVRLIALVLGSTILFVPIWLAMVLEGIRNQQAQETALVFVLDLCFLIPACILTAWHIWHHHPLGYLLAGPLLFKASVSGLLLTGGEMLKLFTGILPAFDQLAMYVFLAAIGLAALVGYLRNLVDDGERLHSQWGRAQSFGGS